jgi:hypothetical protein
MDWATFWAVFSPTRLVALFGKVGLDGGDPSILSAERPPLKNYHSIFLLQYKSIIQKILKWSVGKTKI